MANERRSGGAAWRILVVDDVPVESWACVAALETVTDDWYDVKAETSPRAALEIAREWRPDLVILDINMPEMDGYELARCLKDDGCDASRLFLTSRDEAEDEIEGLELADDYIQKPFKARIFLRRVRNILHRRPQPNAAQTPRDRRPQPNAAKMPRDWRPQVDAVHHRVTMPDGRVKRLTPTEQKVLAALLHANGEVVSYADLIREVWVDEARGADVAFEVKDYLASMSQAVRRLREKIEIEPGQPRFILNVERVGYCYNLRPDGPDASD